MLAFASPSPRKVGPYLCELARLSRWGNLVQGWERRPGGNHPDGWGAAWRQGGGIHLVRSAKAACSDPLAAALTARADRLIAHARYASNAATVNAANAHPFRAGGIVVAHNGTFYGRIGDEAARRNVSDTLVFCEHLGAAWTERTLEGLREVLSHILSDEALVGDYSAANLLVMAGEGLFALRNFRHNPDYYTLYLRARAEETVAASEPPEGGTDFRLLENGELVALAPASPGPARVAFLP